MTEQQRTSSNAGNPTNPLRPGRSRVANVNPSSSPSTAGPTLGTQEVLAQELKAAPKPTSVCGTMKATQSFEDKRPTGNANSGRLSLSKGQPLSNSAFGPPRLDRRKDEGQVTGGETKEEEKLRAKRQRRAPFVRRQWNEEEDEAITALVKRHGTKQWSKVARLLEAQHGIVGRTGKQCRER